MNIFVSDRTGANWFLRPDATLNKDCSDYWLPDGLDYVIPVPFAYIRIDKNAKSVATRFARRYYSTSGYGVYLYTDQLPFCMGQSLDFSTLVSPSSSTGDSTANSIPALEQAFSNISSLCSLKSGDLVCIALENEPHRLSKGESYSFMDIKFSVK